MLQYLSIVVLLSFISCSATNQTPKFNEKPAWVMNPHIDGKRGAVGIAGRTYDQSESSQRKLAISRALDELALQNNVKVTLSMQKTEHVVNDNASVDVKVGGDYKAKATLSAHIEDMWKDKLSGEIYIWMVLDK